MKTAYLLFVLAALVSPSGYAQPVKVTVVPVELGGKTQLSILLSGLPVPAPQPMQLIADVEVFGTDGRSLAAAPRCCQATVPRGSREPNVKLSSTVILEPDSTRSKGSYTVRVSVTDGTQTWTANEVLPYGAPAEGPGLHEAAPKLRQNLPPAATEPGGPGDRRDCLGLPTRAEVIKCSEKKK